MTAPQSSPMPDIPAIGHNHPPDSESDDLVEAFTDILTTRRSRTLDSHIETAFQKANIHRDLRKFPIPDPLLLDLFGFEEANLPVMDNLFCADLGVLFEKLVKCLFEKSRPDIVDTSPASMKAAEERYSRLPANKRIINDKETWKAADFFLGRNQIVEAKYRFNSYDSKPKQINAAHAYRALGYKPVFLHLSSEFQSHCTDFEKAGWEVHYGQDAVQYINDHTGTDILEIIRKVAAQPIVHQRIEAARRAMITRMKEQAACDFRYGLPEIREHLFDVLANDAEMLSSFASTYVDGPVKPALSTEKLAERVEALNDATIAEIDTEDVNAAYQALDKAQRKAFLTSALADLDENDKLDILSRT